MVLTETINYHTNHVGAIRNNKDRLKDEFNVDIVITKNRFGEYQEVDIIGCSKSIKIVKQKLKNIVDIAQYEYNQFRDRKKERIWSKRKKNSSNDFQQTSLVYTSKKKENYSNPFYALAVDEELNQTNDNKYTELPNIYIDSTSTSYNNVSWGDMSDDE